MNNHDYSLITLIRIVTLALGLFLLLCSYPSYDFHIITIIPLIIFGLCVDLIIISFVRKKVNSIDEIEDIIYFSPNVEYKARITVLTNFSLLQASLMCIDREYAWLYLTIMTNVIAIISLLYFWSALREACRQIIINKSARSIDVSSRNFLFKKKQKSISLNEFSTVVSSIERYASSKNTFYLKNALHLISQRRRLKLLLIEFDPAETGNDSAVNSENETIKAIREDIASKLGVADKGFDKIDISYYVSFLV
nr:hypothetical protein [uncultured Tolumonas sp.]